MREMKYNIYEPQQERPATVKGRVIWDGESLTKVYVLIDSPQEQKGFLIRDECGEDTPNSEGEDGKKETIT